MIDSGPLSLAAEDRNSGDFSLEASNGMALSKGSGFKLLGGGHERRMQASFQLDHYCLRPD